MACTKQTARGRSVTGLTGLTQARMNSEKAKRLEEIESIHNTSMKRTQKDPTPKRLKTIPTDVSIKKKKRKGRNSISSTKTTTSTNTDMMTTGRITPHPTLSNTTAIIEPTPNISTIPPIPPPTTTFSTITLPTSFPLQMDNDILSTHMADPTSQHLPLKTNETETLEVLDITNINVEDRPEMTQDASKDISFEIDE